MESLKELLDARAKLIADARKILDTADADGKRQLSTDERGQYDRIDVDIEKLSDQIETKRTDETRATRHAKYDAMLAEAAGRQIPALRPGTPRGGDGAESLSFDFGRAGKLASEDIQEASSELAERLRARSMPAYRKAFKSYLRGDHRNFERLGLQIGDDSRGGYTSPMQFLSMLIKFLDDAVQVRRLATVLPPTTAPNVGALSYDTDYADATWTAEVPASDLAEDDAARFGRREMIPHLLSKLVKTSRKMLASPMFPIEDFLAKRLAYKFGITENKGFLSGTGQQQPLGLFTADSAGIGTGQDVTATGAAPTTNFVPDDLISTLENIKSTYQERSTWIASRAFRQRARKLKSGTGEYLLVEPNGNNSGVMSTLVGRPLVVDENAPNTFTTGKYIAILGDMSFYWIQDGIDLQIQRLDELLALRNQVGWIGRKETDAMPVLAEAFSRLKLA